MAQVFAKDTYVWLPDEEDGYTPAKVMGTFKAGEKGTVLNLNTKAAYPVSAAESKQLSVMDEQSLTPLADMVELKQLDEPALLHNLRLRYEEDNIYTSIGSILVSVNPFKKLNIYSPEIVDQFVQRGANNNPPHIFGVSDRAYKNLVDNKVSQSCIVSGESGAGKTEATKLFLQYLAEKSSSGDEKAKTGATLLHEKILEANPLMEAFGNAKTTRNNNSSRFGKLIQVDFDNKRGKIVGGNITQYLLEKSRLVYQATGERNYHIFYQLCEFASMDLEFNKDLKLVDSSQYFYTNPYDDPKGTRVEGINDANEFENTLNAMDVLEISDADQKDVFVALAGILHLGNVEFEAVGEASRIKEQSKSVLALSASQLGVDAEALGKALVKRKLNDVFKEHSVDEAMVARDAFAKALYGFMFEWLIARINASLSSQLKVKSRDLSSISVLDIFGFESFETNSFEQLCINYCNEKLQGHFNEHIFSLEQELYKREGIDLTQINFADNSPTLDILENQKTGVFALLDEENKLPKGSDEGFLTRVDARVDGYILKRPDVKEMRKKKNQLVFIVVHYAGPVGYTITNFLEKNKDRLFEDLSALGVNSKSKFVAKMFSAETANKKTLGFQFRGQLATLMDVLNQTEPHYVRTIKPNEEKVGDLFTAKMIMDQMRYAGLMEVCRIRKLGYPVRKTFKEFVQRYKPLGSTLTLKDHVDLSADLERRSLLIKNEYQIGTTKMFMRTDQYNQLEEKRENALKEVAAKIQKVIRGFIARRRYKKYKKIISDIEAAILTRGEANIENALLGTGILPNVGKHLPVVQKAKKVLAIVKEEKRVLTMIDAAIRSHDIAALNSALAAAEKLNLMDNKQVQEAVNMKDLMLKEKSLIDALVEAVKKNEVKPLQDALKAAEAVKLYMTNAYKDAKSALEHLQEEDTAIAALDAAIAKKDVQEIVKGLTKMAELGNIDHPSVKKGQEIAKEIARASAEAEKEMKSVQQKLQIAVDRQDLGMLKKLKPQVIKFGLQGDLVKEADALTAKLQAKEATFGELSATMQSLELKSKGYDGISEEDVHKFSELIKQAESLGFQKEDEELSAMKDFELKMKSQLEVQETLKNIVKSKDENELKRGLAMIQDLGLETGMAKEIEQEMAVLETRKVEQMHEERRRQKEEIKNNLKEGDEDAREAEKHEMLSKRTPAHQELIAKASDSTKYHFSKYYKLREDADYLEFIPEEAKSEFAELKLQYQNKLIPKSLSSFPAEVSKLSVQVHKAILQYCGDLSNPYPNTMARFMIVTCLENPILVDEVYLLLLKHLTDNRKPVSEDRGWGLLCMLTNSVPPTDEFAPFVVNFLLNNKNKTGLIGNYAGLCIVQLDGRIRLGPTKLLPDLGVVDTYSQRPPILAIINRVGEKEPLEIPVTPDEDVDRVLTESIFPLLDIEEKVQFLYGIFVIDGKPKSTLDFKTRLTRYYQKYNPTKMQHVDYFAAAWVGNEEALFHKLESKYGPEPTDEEIAQLMEKRGKKEKKNLLVLPITAAKSAAKRLGLSNQESRRAPSPQTAWPVPWWVHLGDVYLRMVKQNRIPIFTFKRKLFANGEAPTPELIEQAKYEVVNGDLAIAEEADIVDLTAIHLTLKNNNKPPSNGDEMLKLGLVDIIPLNWLAVKSPKEFVPIVKTACAKLEGANAQTLNTKYMQICRKQVGFGMWFFYLTQENSPEPLVAGVDTKGVHLLNESRSQLLETFNYKKIKEYGASPTHFWMKIVEKKPTAAKKVQTIEDTVYLNTIQAWDLYGLVYDYTYHSKELKLE